MKLCASVLVHDDNTFLSPTLKAISKVPRFVFVSRKDWKGNSGDWEKSVQIAEAEGASVVLGDWQSESEHRRGAYAYLLQHGFTHSIIADSDEILEQQLLDHLIRIAEGELADRVYVEWDTYWKSPEYVIRPRERFTPCILIDLRNASHAQTRDFEGGRSLFLNASFGIIHHLSYAGCDERIWKKITTWGHRDEVVPGWWERVWKTWDHDRLLRGLHPTHPSAYGFAERIAAPDIFFECGVLPRRTETETPEAKPKNWPKISVVIPACGGQDDLDQCLRSLEDCRDLLEEVVVVDNGSRPKLKASKLAKVMRNETNEGFARACNKGWSACRGDVALFLNSDTQVPRISLIRLAESLMASGSIAAAGPYTNNCGHFQRIEPTYTSADTLSLFARDFAERTAEDVDTDMLVGFCLAVKRSALDEVGGFDERFGLGTFEDNDLSYRMRRAGYRLVIASRSFVHHEGSKTMRRLERSSEEEPARFDFETILQENHRKYLAKWREDLECGFASTLSGLSSEPVRFDPARKPEARHEAIQELVRQADISLCMIAKNEERVIRDCLESARPFFKEILFLDTGSTDRTPEIAAECGALVSKTEWPDSFAKARTESMKGASGKWIMWIDADDTVPSACGEEIFRAVAHAPEDIIGFVVPVRFVEEQGFGTEVDHVKIFRNYPGLEWEGRIHEQILPSLRRVAAEHGQPEGKIARLNAYVLHSGYDTSDAGQARKRERDEKLLKLDLEERPNHPFVLFNLGMTAHYTHDHEAAIEWFERCIQHSTEAESHVRKAYALWGASLRLLGRGQEARRVLLEGLEKVQGDPEIQFHLAQIAFSEGELDYSAKLYEEVLNADISGYFTSIDPAILGYKTRHNLALVDLSRGDYEAARGHWIAALEGSGRPEIASTLFDTAMDRKDVETGKQMLSWTLQRSGFSEAWAAMACRLAVFAGLDPAVYLRQAVEDDPRNMGVRKVLATELLNSGRREEAVLHLDFLQACGVAEGAYFLGLLAEEAGDSGRALAWLERALELNPGHADTAERVKRFRENLR